MSDDRPPLWLRLCVVIGGTSLVLGLAGVVYLFVHGETPDPVAGAGFAPRVRLVGVAPTGEGTLRVVASWRDEKADAWIRQPGDVVPTDPLLFLLPPASAGRNIHLDVFGEREGVELLLATREMEVTTDHELTFDLGAEPPSR